MRLAHRDVVVDIINMNILGLDSYLILNTKSSGQFFQWNSIGLWEEEIDKYDSDSCDTDENLVKSALQLAEKIKNVPGNTSIRCSQTQSGRIGGKSGW